MKINLASEEIFGIEECILSQWSDLRSVTVPKV
jgi:hypothetical protein